MSPEPASEGRPFVGVLIESRGPELRRRPGGASSAGDSGPAARHKGHGRPLFGAGAGGLPSTAGGAAVQTVRAHTACRDGTGTAPEPGPPALPSVRPPSSVRCARQPWRHIPPAPPECGAGCARMGVTCAEVSSVSAHPSAAVHLSLPAKAVRPCRRRAGVSDRRAASPGPLAVAAAPPRASHHLWAATWPTCVSPLRAGPGRPGVAADSQGRAGAGR